MMLELREHPFKSIFIKSITAGGKSKGEVQKNTPR
jgi:hypothetical protein